MLLALSLALLPFQSPDPGLLTRAATDYCEPYARRDVSMAETVARLQADGFQTYVDPDANTTLLSFEQEAELTRTNGDFVRLYSNGEYRTCRVSRDDLDFDKSDLDAAIQHSGRWLQVAPMMQEPRSHWVSTDGRLNLSSGPVDNGLAQPVDSRNDGVLTATVTSALRAPDVELARREVTLVADQRSPAQAVIRGMDAICPVADQQRSTLSSPLARRLTREEALYFYEAEFARVGAPPFLRQRDPATRVALASPFPCTLAVLGAGRLQAETELRLWLDQSAAPSDEADVWTRPGQTIFLETEDLTLYVTVEVDN